MTVKIPEPDISDKILALFGKKRKLIMPPKEIYEKYGDHVYAVAGKENFWKALFREKEK